MNNNPSLEPNSEYSTRLENRRSLVAVEAAKYRRVGIVRIVFLVFAAAILLRVVTATHTRIGYWLIPVVIISLILIGIHQQIFKQQKRFERAAKFYERGLARLAGNWIGVGNAGESYRNALHPYAEDLDIFGRGSLYELLCSARTRAGEDTLAAWLLAPASREEIHLRQQAIEELKPKLDLREDLALLGEDLRAGINPEALSAWSKTPALLSSKLGRAGALILGALAIITLVLAAFTESLLPFYAVLIAEAALALYWREKVMQVVNGLEPAARDLKLLAQILQRIEQEQFSSEKLVRLRASLDTAGKSPSQQIAQLHSLAAWLEARRNQIGRVLTAPFLWVTNLAFAIESWRLNSGAKVEAWIAAVGEIEALCALANYAYEHPHDPYAEIIAGEMIFAGEGIGHPLIPENRVVRTDITLDRKLSLLVVSGSNMSGKSTLLRTIGMNAVLALAGAPVRAQRLQISPLNLGASIRIQDNLQAGASLFYAEITRLRQLMEMTTEPLPLLFVIDEILHGTNSHDRRIGADAVLRGLIQRGAMGLVTTHDLALTNIVAELGTLAKNVHLEDHLEDGRMTFDYVLREGIVKKSNAIELMRSVGLEV